MELAPFIVDFSFPFGSMTACGCEVADDWVVIALLVWVFLHTVQWCSVGVSEGFGFEPPAARVMSGKNCYLTLVDLVMTQSHLLQR